MLKLNTKQTITTAMERDKFNTRDKLSVVSIVKCQSYDQKMVDKAIEQSLENINGLDPFIQEGTRVHIKPNLLTAKSPEKCATTHPTIVRTIIKHVQELGGIVTIGDSPSGISRPIEEYWQITGMAKVALETGAKLVRFEKKTVVERKVNGSSYFIADAIANADVVINICKLKTHNLTLFTGAIKNMFGSIPGFKKSEYHKQAPNVKDFSRIIVDIFSVTSPQLNIMDAIEVMEGNGPSAGKVKHLGLIFTSKDAVALDSIAAKIMGFEDGEILTTEEAYRRGLGEKGIDNIKLKGCSLGEFQDLQFVLPSNHYLNFIPVSVVKILGKLLWVRPKPDEFRCERCGACIATCPTQAMIPSDGFPIIDYNRCINCFCCDEACPHDAIDQKMSWLVKKFL